MKLVAARCEVVEMRGCRARSSPSRAGSCSGELHLHDRPVRIGDARRQAHRGGAAKTAPFAGGGLTPGATFGRSANVMPAHASAPLSVWLHVGRRLVPASPAPCRRAPPHDHPRWSCRSPRPSCGHEALGGAERERVVITRRHYETTHALALSVEMAGHPRRRGRCVSRHVRPSKGVVVCAPRHNRNLCRGAARRALPRAGQVHRRVRYRRRLTRGRRSQLQTWLPASRRLELRKVHTAGAAGWSLPLGPARDDQDRHVAGCTPAGSQP